jgi:hypothetical protein
MSMPRGDRYMSASVVVAPGAVPPHASPRGLPLPPSIGVGEAGYGQPGSEGRGDRRRRW